MAEGLGNSGVEGGAIAWWGGQCNSGGSTVGVSKNRPSHHKYMFLHNNLS